MLAYIKFPEWLSPVLIPGLPLRWYGLMYLVAFAFTYLLFRFQVRERKLDMPNEEVLNFIFWTIVGLLIGARILATLVYDTSGRYRRNPLLIFWPFDGNMRFTGLAGMSYHGGLIGVIAAVLIYCKAKKRSFFEWGDMLVTAVPLGYTFGRLGNFINGEVYGRVTNSIFGMVFPGAQKFPAGEQWVQEMAEKAGIAISEGQTLVNLPRHPSQLYEAFFEGIVLWLIMWFVFRKKNLVKGVKIVIYIIGYGVFRFFIEYVREPDIGIGFPIKLAQIDNPTYRLLTPWNFTTGQILNFLMIIGGLILLVLANSRTKAEELQTDQKPGKISSRKLRKKIK